MITTNRKATEPRMDGSASSRDIEQEIAQTRQEMDQTLHEIGERLHPKHLLDELLDLLRSGGQHRREAYLRSARKIGRQMAGEFKSRPIPFLLCGVGLAWLAYDELASDDESEQWPGAAWAAGYDWSRSEEDEETWTARARRTLDELKTSIADSTRPAGERLKALAAHAFSLSGRKPRDLHAQWASLQEYSGSFVDARTGEPYDENYGREFRNLLACNYCATANWTAEQEQSWSEKAVHFLEEIQSVLADAGSSVKSKLTLLTSRIGEFVGSTRDIAADYGRHMGSYMSEAGSEMGARSSHAWQTARRGSRRAGRQIGEQVRRGAAYGREQFSAALDACPLAVGAAFLGLGLISGLALPRTHVEDETLGAASDELKHQVQQAGSELAEVGQQLTQGTLQADQQQDSTEPKPDLQFQSPAALL